MSYSDSNPTNRAASTELRAAHFAQGAGYRYFVFDGRDSTVVNGHIENDLNYDKVPQHNTTGASRSVIQPRDLVPHHHPHVAIHV